MALQWHSCGTASLCPETRFHMRRILDVEEEKPVLVCNVEYIEEDEDTSSEVRSTCIHACVASRPHCPAPAVPAVAAAAVDPSGGRVSSRVTAVAEPGACPACPHSLHRR